MLSIHFNKQVFINSLKTNSKLVIYLSTTLAIFLMILMHGLIQGIYNLNFLPMLLLLQLFFTFGILLITINVSNVAYD